MPTFSLPPDVSIAPLLIEGRFVYNRGSGCVEFLLASNERLAILWEPGYTAQFEPLRIFNERGVLVASENENVFVGASGGGPAQPNCDMGESFYVFEVSHDPGIDPR